MKPAGGSESGPQAVEMRAGGRLTQTQSTKIPPQDELHRKIEALCQKKMKNDNNTRLRHAKSVYFVQYILKK